MLCPNCSEMMKSDYYDNQYVSHCASCGASFFEENGINRITFDTALKLSAEKYQNLISPKDKVCPKDFSPLSPLSNTQAVPSNVILFLCPSCSGVFTYANDLLKFKKAQGAKIDYYKTWDKPFATIHSVLVVFIILVLAGTTYLTFSTIQNRSTIRSEASDLFKTLSIIKSGRYILLGFRTNTPLKSQIIITNTKSRKSITKDVSKEVSTIHQVVLTELLENEQYTYQFVLTDKEGKSLRTGVKKLVISR